MELKCRRPAVSGGRIMMSRSLRLLLLLACVTRPEVVGDMLMTPRCATGWMRFNSYCYRYIPKLMNWSDAEHECQLYRNESHLASIQNPEEGSTVAGYIRHFPFDSSVWIGLQVPYKKKLRQWSDGSRFNYRPWSKMFFDESAHCAELSHEHNFLRWNQNNCSELNHFLCKYPL